MAHKGHSPWAVILAWFIANLLAVAVIALLPFIPPVLPIRVGKFMSSLIIGVPIGLAQWIALRRIAPISILWVLTISAGLILGHVLTPALAGVWVFQDDESVLTLTADYVTIGLLVGLVQWTLLRSYFAKSLVWLLSSAVGLGLGTGLILITNLVDQSGIGSIILVVLVYAIATGLVVSWMPISATEDQAIKPSPA
jgi:hypothetical protein